MSTEQNTAPASEYQVPAAREEPESEETITITPPRVIRRKADEPEQPSKPDLDNPAQLHSAIREEARRLVIEAGKVDPTGIPDAKDISAAMPRARVNVLSQRRGPLRKLFARAVDAISTAEAAQRRSEAEIQRVLNVQRRFEELTAQLADATARLNEAESIFAVICERAENSEKFIVSLYWGDTWPNGSKAAIPDAILQTYTQALAVAAARNDWERIRGILTKKRDEHAAELHEFERKHRDLL